MTHYVYTKEVGDICEGASYRNPQYFERAYGDATKVTIIGDWPEIAAAYEEAGVTVEVSDGEVIPLDDEMVVDDAEEGDEKDRLIAALAGYGVEKDRRSSEETLRRILTELENEDE